ELSGGTAFPKIGQLTYLLTLPPHGFYWFTLSAEALPPPWSTSTSGPAIEHRTFVLRGELIELSAAPQTNLLASEILPPYIRERRWFQGKDRKITKIEILAQGAWPKTADMLYNEISVRSGERADNYNLILSIAWEGSKLHPFEVPLAMARVRRGRRVGLLTDAFASPAFAHSLVEGMQTNAR